MFQIILQIGLPVLMHSHVFAVGAEGIKSLANGDATCQVDRLQPDFDKVSFLQQASGVAPKTHLHKGASIQSNKNSALVDVLPRDTKKAHEKHTAAFAAGDAVRDVKDINHAFVKSVVGGMHRPCQTHKCNINTCKAMLKGDFAFPQSAPVKETQEYVGQVMSINALSQKVDSMFAEETKTAALAEGTGRLFDYSEEQQCASEGFLGGAMACLNAWKDDMQIGVEERVSAREGTAGNAATAFKEGMEAYFETTLGRLQSIATRLSNCDTNGEAKQELRDMNNEATDAQGRVFDSRQVLQDELFFRNDAFESNPDALGLQREANAGTCREGYPKEGLSCFRVRQRKTGKFDTGGGGVFGGKFSDQEVCSSCACRRGP